MEHITTQHEWSNTMNVNIMRQCADIEWDEYDMIVVDDPMLYCDNPF